MAALVNHTCLALLILPENLHHICFHFFASQISSNDFCYLKAYSNVLQHVSVCENPCNTKSLYCLCLYTDFCNRGAFISVYFFMWAMQMWRLWSSWGLARRPRLLYMPDILCFLCIPLWALLFYSIMTLLICVQCVTCWKLPILICGTAGCLVTLLPSQHCSSFLQWVETCTYPYWIAAFLFQSIYLYSLRSFWMLALPSKIIAIFPSLNLYENTADILSCLSTKSLFNSS